MPDDPKKELVGQYKNGGREWRPGGEPEQVNVHDFMDRDLGKAVPYGVYDVAADTGWVNVGTTTTPRSSPSRRSAAGGTPSARTPTRTREGC
jgi:hypothetical protein